MSKVKKKNKMGKSAVTRTVMGILLAILIVYALALILSMLWGFMTSLKSPQEFTDLDFRNVMGLPYGSKKEPNTFGEGFSLFDNYANIFKGLQYTREEIFYRGGTEVVHRAQEVTLLGMLGNTLLYTLGGALIYALMPAFTAYLCAKYDEFKLSGILYVVYIFMMCMPIVGSQPAELTFLRNIGIYDTIWGNYIQKMTGSGMYFFVYFAYFKGVSNTYREAAELDGASQFTIMVRIYAPLAIKMIATVFLIQFVTLWNDYQTPLLYLPTHPTLAFGVYWLANLNTVPGSVGEEMRKLGFNETPVKIAGYMMLAIPITVFFIIFKDKLMGDVSLGGIKE